jgi:hypothetical protein
MNDYANKSKERKKTPANRTILFFPSGRLFHGSESSTLDPFLSKARKKVKPTSVIHFISLGKEFQKPRVNKKKL